MRILLAEDDPSISTIARMTLEHMGGHQVTVVSNGSEALQTALAGGFDLILLDEMMPKMNGLKVCAAYKQNCSSPAPVIFLSAKSQTDEVVKEFQREGIGFIAKPFDPQILCQQIDSILAAQRSAI